MATIATLTATETGALSLSDINNNFSALNTGKVELTGASGGQTIIGSTGTSTGLTFQSTSGVGASGADFIFKGGNAGATEFARFLNSGNLGIGTNNPLQLLNIYSATTNAWIRMDATTVTNIVGIELRDGQGTSGNYSSYIYADTRQINFVGTSLPHGLIFVSGRTSFEGHTFVKGDGTTQFHISKNGLVGVGSGWTSSVLPTAGIHLPASTTSNASACLPHGSAPTSPVNGDMWTTTSGLFVRINGVTKTVTLT